jgi:hypothetical protein
MDLSSLHLKRLLNHRNFSCKSKAWMPGQVPGMTGFRAEGWCRRFGWLEAWFWIASHAPAARSQ